MSEPTPEQPDWAAEALRKMDLPDSPITDLDSAILAWRTIYEKFEERGFSQSQALYLTGSFLLGNPGQAPSR